jgi:two-component system, chemotaxis family, chemotaxis protein CheY
MKKILIADDASFMRSVIKDLLAPLGHTLIEAVNGKEALEKIVAEKPDLVLLDIIMPELDGVGVLQKIRTTVPVIVISAVGQSKMVDEAKRLGARDYIVKPLDVEKDKKELLDKVRTALE